MWALIPLKNFVEAKQRLSGMLSAAERRGIVQTMVEDVLDVLIQQPQLRRIILLSDDPAAALLAEHFNIDHWSEKTLGAKGLNGVVNAAAARIAELTTDSLMVVHGDIPLIDAAELDGLLAAHQAGEQRRVTIATDRHDRGSNIVLCSPASVMTFAYGEDSCQDHRRHAVAANADFQVLQLQGISRDIDNGGDLLELLDPAWSPRASRTLRYLAESNIASRLRAMAAGGANAELCERDIKS